MTPTVEHHGWCKHSASSWSLALSAALACAGKNIPPNQRQAAVKLIMMGGDLWVGGVLFKKAS